MLKCINGHEQPDDAKFCGICGSVIEPNIQSNSTDDPALSEWAEVAGEALELDLMGDDTDDLADADATDDTDDDVGAEDLDDDADATDDTDDDTDDTDDDADAEDLDDDADATDDTDDTDDLGQDDSQAPRPFLFGTTVNSDAMQNLHDWAVEYEEANHPYIKGLTDAVANRDDLSMWASLDPQELLPRPEPIDGKRWETISSLTGFLRNVLVFVPVLLTWLSIGRAVDSFGQYASWFESEKGTVLNLQFLQFWQNPNKYLDEANLSLSHFWWIGNVAFFDAILIFTIILLTFVSGSLSVKADSDNAKAQEEIDLKRLALGLQISNSLHGKRQANPESIGEALAEALNDLTQAARDVNESASRLESVSVGVAALNPHIEALNQSTNTFVSSTGAQISDSVKELVSSVQNLNSAVGGNVTSLFAEAALTIEEASKQLARTNASVEYGTKQLREDLDAIHQQLQSIVRGGR
jgi:uncharacterized protein YoxC